MAEQIPTTMHGEWISGRGELGLVSVIVPVYNREQSVGKALDSVWRQTYRPIELIVVDDGSTDGTGKSLKCWGRNHSDDPNFYFRRFHQDNSGAPAARNLGTIKSRGVYIQYLDSDDLLYEDRFETLIHFLERENCDSVHSGFDRRCGNCGEFLGRYVPKDTDNPLAACLRGKLWINTFDFFDRRSLIARIGPWDESLISAQDRDFSFRRLLYAERTAVLNKALCSCEMSGSDRISIRRKTREGWKSRLVGEERLCQAIGHGRNDIPDDALNAYATHLYSVGVLLYASGHTGLASRYGELAAGIERFISTPGQWRMRTLWQSGALPCWLWVNGRELKRKVKKRLGRERKPHVCI